MSNLPLQHFPGSWRRSRLPSLCPEPHHEEDEEGGPCSHLDTVAWETTPSSSASSIDWFCLPEGNITMEQPQTQHRYKRKHREGVETFLNVL